MKKILIVEDDDLLANLMTAKMQSNGYNVDLAIDGNAALECIKSNTYDVIILDLMLPLIDGFTVLSRIKEQKLFSDQRIIVFSNLGSDVDVQKVADLGVVHYMVKSRCTLDDLANKVQEVLS